METRRAAALTSSNQFSRSDESASPKSTQPFVPKWHDVLRARFQLYRGVEVRSSPLLTQLRDYLRANANANANEMLGVEQGDQTSLRARTISVLQAADSDDANGSADLNADVERRILRIFVGKARIHPFGGPVVRDLMGLRTEADRIWGDIELPRLVNQRVNSWISGSWISGDAKSRGSSASSEKHHESISSEGVKQGAAPSTGKKQKLTSLSELTYRQGRTRTLFSDCVLAWQKGRTQESNQLTSEDVAEAFSAFLTNVNPLDPGELLDLNMRLAFTLDLLRSGQHGKLGLTNERRTIDRGSLKADYQQWKQKNALSVPAAKMDVSVDGRRRVLISDDERRLLDGRLNSDQGTAGKADKS